MVAQYYVNLSYLNIHRGAYKASRPLSFFLTSIVKYVTSDLIENAVRLVLTGIKPLETRYEKEKRDGFVQGLHNIAFNFEEWTRDPQRLNHLREFRALLRSCFHYINTSLQVNPIASLVSSFFIWPITRYATLKMTVPENDPTYPFYMYGYAPLAIGHIFPIISGQIGSLILKYTYNKIDAVLGGWRNMMLENKNLSDAQVEELKNDRSYILKTSIFAGKCVLGLKVAGYVLATPLWVVSAQMCLNGSNSNLEAMDLRDCSWHRRLYRNFITQKFFGITWASIMTVLFNMASPE